MSEFKQGDKVRGTISDCEYTVVTGPHSFKDGPYYLASSSSGNPAVVLASNLAPIPPADPRVEVAKLAAFKAFHVRGILYNDGDGTAVVAAVLAALDAMTD